MSPGVAGITGLGCICAAGESLETIMPAIYSGKRNPVPPSRVRSSLNKISPVFEIPSDLDDLSTGKALSRTTLLSLQATREALHQAELDHDVLQKRRVGVVIGTTVGCTLNNEPFYRAFRKEMEPDIEPVETFLNNNPALFLSRAFECTGPSATIANACSSGTDAIGLAKSWVEDGLADIVIAGGTDELCRTTYIGFTSLLITSTEPCRPFDRNRNGLNLGEGAGILIVESPESASDRGAEIISYVAGYGSSADAYHPTAPHPDGLGLERAIIMALKDAGLSTNDIAFINAHGTSTEDNDLVEGKVIERLFPAGIPVVSTKSYTGHTLGAAGGIEAVFTVKALQDKKVPATAGLEYPDPDCRIVPTMKNTTIGRGAAISNSLAFGGNNAALLFRIGNS